MKTVLFLTLILSTSFASADLAFDLLQASDQARGSLQDGLTWNSEVETHEEGDVSTRKFLVKAKGVNAYVDALEPARTKGEIYLFNDRTMWFFKPSLKKPVAISSRQKLSGQAANGDIASTHYARDYTPTIEKTEMDGKEKMHVLMLKAKANNLTYDQIRYWISDKTRKAVKAEFLTLQGQPFKKAKLEYNNKLKVGGKTIEFVSQIEIVDVKNESNKSIIRYKNPKIEQHADSIFNISNLKR